MVKSPEAKWTLESFSMRWRITSGTVTRTCSDGCCCCAGFGYSGERLSVVIDGYMDEEEDEWEKGEFASGLVDST